MTGARLKDNSGLSSGQVVPARVISDVMQLGITGSATSMTRVLSDLPIAGLTGTLHDRFLVEESHGAAGIARAHVLGHALGGLVGLELARRHPPRLGDPGACRPVERAVGHRQGVVQRPQPRTDRPHRRRGLAQLAKLTALHEVAGYWPRVRRCYCSVAAKDAAMNAIYRSLGARELSRSSAWELRLRD